MSWTATPGSGIAEMEPGLYAKKLVDGKIFCLRVPMPEEGIVGDERATFDTDAEALKWLVERGAIEKELLGEDTQDMEHSQEPHSLEHTQEGQPVAPLELETHSECPPLCRDEPAVQMGGGGFHRAVTFVDTLSEETRGLLGHQ